MTLRNPSPDALIAAAYWLTKYPLQSDGLTVPWRTSIAHNPDGSMFLTAGRLRGGQVQIRWRMIDADGKSMSTAWGTDSAVAAWVVLEDEQRRGGQMAYDARVEDLFRASVGGVDVDIEEGWQ